MSTITAKQTVPYGPRDAGALLTLDEFEEADYELGYRYELIHGVLVVTPLGPIPAVMLLVVLVPLPLTPPRTTTNN